MKDINIIIKDAFGREIKTNTDQIEAANENRIGTTGTGW